MMLNVLPKFHAYIIFYCPFLPASDRKLYENECLQIYQKREEVDAGKKEIKEIQSRSKENTHKG